MEMGCCELMSAYVLQHSAAHLLPPVWWNIVQLLLKDASSKLLPSNLATLFIMQTVKNLLQ